MSSRKPPSKTTAKMSSSGSSTKQPFGPEPPLPPLAKHPNQSTPSKAHQQAILDIFSTTFNHIITAPNFSTILQEVKSALYARDFTLAFSRKPYLEAYAARWSPTRALAYADILSKLFTPLDDVTIRMPKKPRRSAGGGGGSGDRKEENPADDDDDAIDDDEEDEAEARKMYAENPAFRLVQGMRILSIGGGAAEIAAVGLHLATYPDIKSACVTLIDIASWSGVVEKLQNAITTPPPLSKYASASAVADNAALVEPERLHQVTFVERDVLSIAADRKAWSEIIDGDARSRGGRQPVLVTLFFTMNELLAAEGGMGKMSQILFILTSLLQPGSLILVVDSPGDYSEIEMGKDGEKRKYPMHWLVDKILIDMIGTWEKVASDYSAWFRHPKDRGLTYPIELEDMRYQYHLYRALPAMPRMLSEVMR